MSCPLKRRPEVPVGRASPAQPRCSVIEVTRECLDLQFVPKKERAEKRRGGPTSSLR